MPRRVVIEQFHVTVFVPSKLSPTEVLAVRRALTGPGFRGRLRRAADAVVNRYRSLRRATVHVSR